MHGSMPQHLEASGDGFTSLEFTPDGTRLVAQFEPDPDLHTGPDHAPTLAVWDLHTGQVLMQLVSNEAFSCTPDGRCLIYSDEDAVLRRVALPASSQAGPAP